MGKVGWYPHAIKLLHHIENCAHTGIFYTTGAMRAPHHNFVVIAPMIMKFGTGINLDIFYTKITKKLMTSLLLRNYDVITCILADT